MDSSVAYVDLSQNLKLKRLIARPAHATPSTEAQAAEEELRVAIDSRMSACTVLGEEIGNRENPLNVSDIVAGCVQKEPPSWIGLLPRGTFQEGGPITKVGSTKRAS
jgi:hypothetical protein